MRCHGKTTTVSLLDGDSNSSLQIANHHDNQLLSVYYARDDNNMVIELQGKRFDVMDEATREEEAAMFRQLWSDPQLEYFPQVVRHIHDDLQLKGWQSPAVMFLYQLGMAAQNYRLKTQGAERGGLEKRDAVDPDIYPYHGEHPTKQCRYDGRSAVKIDSFIADGCYGLCGPGCRSCWHWVCGDCCVHTGCARHDAFCSKPGGWFNSDCFTGRGVLWDKISNTAWDCDTSNFFTD